MKLKYLKALSILLFLFGIFFLINLKIGVTGRVIGNNEYLSPSFILSIIFISIGVLAFIGGKNLEKMVINKQIKKDNRNELKIMSYNIKDGFYDNLFNNPNPKYQSERENLAKEVVSKYNPDILIIPEACCFKENHKVKKIQNYQEIFGKENFPFIGHADMFQDGVFGIAVLSKYPIKSEDLSEKGKALIRTYVELPNKKKIIVDGIHLMPSQINKEENNSSYKGSWINEKIKDIDNSYIIAGDFNAISPQDEYDKEKMLKGFNSLPWNNKESSQWIVEDLLKSKEVEAVLSKGLSDTYKQVRNKQDYTLPTKLNNTTTDSAQRVDYIFCSPDIRIKNAGIIKDKLTEKASDHYPVYAELEI